jgi:hypothetical protein
MDNSESRKRPYRQPQLKVYGDIKTITASVAVEGNVDGAGPSAVPNRTD